MLTIAVHAVSLTSLHTVSVWIKPWVCIFQNGFLGGVLFEFDLPGVVIKLGLYLLRSADFKPLTACAYFKSLSTPNAHWQIPILWKLNLIWLIKEHKEVFFFNSELSSLYVETGWGSTLVSLIIVDPLICIDLGKFGWNNKSRPSKLSKIM